jgi:DNA primase
MDSVFYEHLTNACHDFLWQRREICEYLGNRGITKKTVQAYKLGAFPKKWSDLFKKVNGQELRDRGIVYNASNSPFSHHPLVIPIHDSSGNPVAIGCRTLMPEKDRKKLGVPKYRNSVYTKTAHLFGLNVAIPSIREKNKVYVVEGFMDTLSAHQHGHKNVVATCGTLFSKRQLIILLRYTNNICIMFDNDEAGKTNSSIVMQKFAKFELAKFSSCCTPQGFKDLDEYLHAGQDFSYFENII